MQKKHKSKRSCARKSRFKSSMIAICVLLVSVFVGWKFFPFSKPISHNLAVASNDATYHVATVGEKDFNDELLPVSTDDIREAIQPLEASIELGQSVKKLLAQLHGYDNLFSEARQTCSGCRVDVILQLHGSDEMQLNLDPAVVKNQAMVAKLLVQGKYDVAAIEGWRADRITIESAIQEVCSYSKTLTAEQARMGLDNQLPVQGGLQYAFKNPSALVIGSEDYALHSFEGMLVEKLHPSRENFHPELVGLAGLTICMRSELAVAKVLIKLKEVKGKRGVVVIGCAHQDSIVATLKHFHAISDVFIIDY